MGEVQQCDKSCIPWHLCEHMESYIDNLYNFAEYKAWLEIWNLFHCNAIIGMTEEISRSMHISQHVLGNDAAISQRKKKGLHKLFKRCTPLDGLSLNSSQSHIHGNSNKDGRDNYNAIQPNQLSKGIMRNASQQRIILTLSMLEALQKDNDFILVFWDYLNYIQMVVDLGWKMHLMQFDAVLESTAHFKSTWSTSVALMVLISTSRQ